MLKKQKLKKQYFFCDIFIIGSILIGGGAWAPFLATPMSTTVRRVDLGIIFVISLLSFLAQEF